MCVPSREKKTVTLFIVLYPGHLVGGTTWPGYKATSFKMGLFLEDYEIYLGSLKYALCCRAGRQFAFSLESWEEKYFALER